MTDVLCALLVQTGGMSCGVKCLCWVMGCLAEMCRLCTHPLIDKIDKDAQNLLAPQTDSGSLADDNLWMRANANPVP